MAGGQMGPGITPNISADQLGMPAASLQQGMAGGGIRQPPQMGGQGLVAAPQGPMDPAGGGMRAGPMTWQQPVFGAGSPGAAPMDPAMQRGLLAAGLQMLNSRGQGFGRAALNGGMAAGDAMRRGGYR